MLAFRVRAGQAQGGTIDVGGLEAQGPEKAPQGGAELLLHLGEASGESVVADRPSVVEAQGSAILVEEGVMALGIAPIDAEDDSAQARLRAKKPGR